MKFAILPSVGYNTLIFSELYALGFHVNRCEISTPKVYNSDLF